MSIYLRTESLEREKRRGPNKKKIRESKTVSWNVLRIRSASPMTQEASMRLYTGAGMILP
jgi:hypothetical protein